MPKLTKRDRALLRGMGIATAGDAGRMPTAAEERHRNPWAHHRVRLFRPPDEVMDVRKSDLELVLEGNTEEPWEIIRSRREWRRRLLQLPDLDPASRLLLQADIEPSRANWLYINHWGAVPTIHPEDEIPFFLRLEDED